MATINPFQPPINYAVDVQSPFEAALGGFKLGAGVAEIEAARQTREKAQATQTELANLFKNPLATAADYDRVAAFLPKDQAAIVTQGFERKTKEQQANDLRMGAEVYSAIKSGNLPVAKQMLTDQATAFRNSGREDKAKAIEDSIKIIDLNPTGAQATIGLYMARLPGGTDFLNNADKALSIIRTEALAKPTLDKAVADASAAVADAKKKVAEAEDTPSRLLAEADLRSAQTAQQRALTAASEGEEARKLTKFAPELRETIAKADAAVADAEKRVAEAKDTPTRLVAENNLRVAQAAQANAAAAKSKKDLEDEGVKVQSSKILDNGTAVFVTTNGKTRVIGPDGVELTGQERVDAVREAEQFGADIQQLRSGARKAGEVGQTEAAKAFENVGKIRRNISNLDSAIAALDAGATTGVIASKFPNWKASTIELQNVQRQLGLDIIGSVTFGALSEGELSLALETALPLNMNEPQLKDWLIRKKTAQNKLADYITEQARFLSIPGRSLGDWLIQAEKRGQPPGMTAPGTGAAGAAAAAAPPLPKSATVGGKTYTRPPSFTDKQWGDYLKAQGVMQ